MKNLDQPSSRVLWADAAAVGAVVFSRILAARSARPLAEAGAFLARPASRRPPCPRRPGPAPLLGSRSASWSSRAGDRRRRGSRAAVGYEIVVLAKRVHGDPAYIDPPDVMAWPLVLAVAAAALLSVPAPVGRGLDLLGRHGMWLIGAAAAVTTLMAMAIPLVGDYHAPPPEGSVDPGVFPAFMVSSQIANAIQGVTFVVVVTLTLAAVMAARRRRTTLIAA